MLLKNKVKKNKILVFFVLLLLTHAVYAQEAYNWKTLSSKKAVNDAVQVGSTIWAATSGGAFSYNLNTGTYFTLSRTDGLRGVILQAVAVDKYGKIWFGSQDGVIDVYNPVSKQTQSIYDIYNFKEQNGINSFLVKGDSVFVSTDFGVALYQASTLKSIDSYLKFGSFESKVPVKTAHYFMSPHRKVRQFKKADPQIWLRLIHGMFLQPTVGFLRAVATILLNTRIALLWRRVAD
jgi:hypothetical protein